MAHKNLKLTLLAGAAALVIGGVAAYSDTFVSGVPVAHAEESSGHSGSGGKGSRGGAGKGGMGGSGEAGHKGQGGHSAEDVIHTDHEDEGDDHEDEEESDRPDWAGTSGKDGKPGRGNTNPGVSKGDIYGDLYLILRDENGVPILNADGYVQPVDADGNPIPLDDEGHPLDEDAAMEVELERLNVGRSPSGVLSSRLSEAVGVINQATAVSLDESGRIVLTIDGEETTIDSPLENMAIYVQLMNEGTLGLTLDNAVLGDLAFLNDGTLTSEDLTAAASFFAAASGKYTPVTVDSVVYVNNFLGVEGAITQDGTKYVDYSTFSYDRSDVYEGVMVDVLVETSPGTYETQSVDLYEAVFGGNDYSSASGIDGFTQATDDARAVIAFVHDNEAR